MKRFCVSMLLTAASIITGGNTHSDDNNPLVEQILKEQKPAEQQTIIDELRQKIMHLQAELALLQAQAHREGPKQKPLKEYYLQIGSENLQLLTKDHWLKCPNDGTCKHITLPFPPKTSYRSPTIQKDLEKEYASLKEAITELKKRLVEIEIFLYTEFPDTFTTVK